MGDLFAWYEPSQSGGVGITRRGMCTDFAIQLERYIPLDVFIVVEADEWFNVYIRQRNSEQLSSSA